MEIKFRPRGLGAQAMGSRTGGMGVILNVTALRLGFVKFIGTLAAGPQPFAEKFESCSPPHLAEPFDIKTHPSSMNHRPRNSEPETRNSSLSMMKPYTPNSQDWKCPGKV